MKGIASIILLLAFIPGCKKEDSDYRDKFTGRYHFEIEHEYRTVHGSIFNLIYVDTVYYYDGNVSKSLNFENEILIDWGSDTLFITNNIAYTQKTEFKIDSNGHLKDLDTLDHQLDSGGYIHLDTIKFYLRLDEGMAGQLYSHWTVAGLKN
jgi:hypothetical protein